MTRKRFLTVLFSPFLGLNVEAIRAFGRPFWLAGLYGSPERVVEALGAGATGVQVRTAFAFCDESGLRGDIKQDVLRMSQNGHLDVFTDAVASRRFSFQGTMSTQR